MILQYLRPERPSTNDNKAESGLGVAKLFYIYLANPIVLIIESLMYPYLGLTPLHYLLVCAGMSLVLDF
jgi:hypothetical protein